MPYIITTTRNDRGPWGEDFANVLTRTAVATLDEAREDIVTMIECAEDPNGPRLDSYWERAHGLDESGGTIGPLPDGTVIEVRRELVTPTLAREARILRSDWFHMSDRAIIAEFNRVNA